MQNLFLKKAFWAASFILLSLLASAQGSSVHKNLHRSAALQTSASESKFVSIKGLDLIAPNGSKLVIKGMNLGNWLNPEGYMLLLGKKANSYRRIDEALKEMVGEVTVDSFWREFQKGYITREDIRYIRKTGMNTLRIPFHYKMLTDEPFMGYASKKHGYALLDTVVNWCRQEGIYAIIDMHCAPGGQTGDNIDDSYGYPFLLTTEENKQRFCAMWKELAAHYANNTTVLAYDLLNEPVASSFFRSDTAMLNRELEALFQRVIKDLRTVDKNHIVLVSGALWGQDYSIFKTWNYDDKLMFTCHRYHFDTSAAKPGIQDFLDWRKKFGRPFYMGETGHEPDEWIKACVALLDKENIGWTFWPYKKMGYQEKDTVSRPGVWKSASMRYTSSMVAVAMPPSWQVVQDYIDADRNSYEAIRKARPNQEAVKATLRELLNNLRFKNNIVNKGYILALGMKP